MPDSLGVNTKRTGGRVVDCNGLENLSGNGGNAPETARFSQFSAAHSAPFPTRSASQDGAEVGTVKARTLTLDDWEWFWFPDGWGVGLFNADKFAAFLDASGYADGRQGVAPELPEWANEESEAQERRAMKRNNLPELTYFARGNLSGRIKIGMTKQRPEVRIKQLAHEQFGEPSTLLCTRHGTHLETIYHKIFHTWRVGGEWFAPHPDILAEIARLSPLPPLCIAEVG